MASKFWDKVDVAGDSDCWNWTGGKSSRGYGYFWFQGREVGSHRVAYILSAGHIPDGLFICHKCDNPLCCNPSHLFLGTPEDNTRDMIQKGRSALTGRPQRGTGNGRSKLCENDIPEIRARFDLGHTNTSIADDYGVSNVTISCIRTGKTWGHVVG